MNLKKYIQNFDFENPDFSELPEGFPRIFKEGLSKEEGHLLDAIVVAWIINRSNTFSRVGAYIQSNKYLDSVATINLKLAKAAFAFFLIAAFSISFISITYYLNIEYDLGLTFLTEMFA